MRELLKGVYRSIIKRLPTFIVINIENIRGYRRLLKKNRIEFFGEKIQWIKLNGGLERYKNLVDKFTVREYVKEKIGEEYLIDLIGVYSNVDEINFDDFPSRFVLKLNTGSGYNFICKDKKKINFSVVKKKINKWLKEDYYKIKKEPQYKNIQKKILCEKFLEDSNKRLLDYKFYCFKGKVEIIEVDFDRFENHTMNFYDTKWNLLKLNKGNYKNNIDKIDKPKKLDEMINIAEKLSEELPFARIDLYYVDDKIYFGEITLTPAGGLTPFKPIEMDIEYAKKINLDLYKHKNIAFFASISKDDERLDGETVKNRLLKEYLEKNNLFRIITIDTHNWKKNWLKIIFNTIKNYKKADKIIVSASQTGAVKLFKFFNKVKCKKKIYYLLIGGSLADHIKEGKRNINEFSNVDKIYVESKKLKKDLEKMGIKNVYVMHNFRKINNKSRITRRHDKEIRFVFFGRVLKVKGIEQSIDLIKRLRKDNYDVSLDIYGQIEEEYLNVLNKKIGKENKIKYCGVINPDGENEYDILSNYDIFILPTEHAGEGLPGALIDSYIAGLAVLVSNWKYAHEYVENDINGYIFEYKNYEDMYDKAKKMIDNNRIDLFKKRSLELSKKYMIDNVLKDFIKEIKND